MSQRKESNLRVLMIVRLFHPFVGGTERQAHKLSQILMSKGVDVKIVTGWWLCDTPQQETLEGVPVYRNFTMWEMFGIRGLRKFGAYLYLLTLFLYLWQHRHEYDLIHVHLLNYHAFVAVLAGKWLKKKTIIKIANSGSRSDLARMKRNELIPGTRQMLPVTLQANKLIAISQLTYDELQTIAVPPERIVRIYNGVEVNSITPKQDYRLHKPITIAFVGRLHSQKRLDLLLSALQKVSQARPNLYWRLLLVGDGPLRSDLEELAQKLNGIGEINFCGEVGNVYTYLAQADLFVLPSQAEGMSNALLEAMAYGLPCIASNIGGNSDLITDGQNGRLVDCNETDALVQAIIDLVENDHQRKKLGQAARQTMEDTFAMEHIANQYLDLYQTLIQETSSVNQNGEPVSKLSQNM